MQLWQNNFSSLAKPPTWTTMRKTIYQSIRQLAQDPGAL
jgi:hypothetical protein